MGGTLPSLEMVNQERLKIMSHKKRKSWKIRYQGDKQEPTEYLGIRMVVEHRML